MAWRAGRNETFRAKSRLPVMPQSTYDRDIHESPIQPRPKFTDAEMDLAFGRNEATMTGEELDAADRAERAAVQNANRQTDGSVLGPASPAEAAELYEHYAD
jgi:hypothetical protein